jgi:signal transduction histidine kinase
LLLFATAAVGLVLLMGALLVSGAFMGQRTRDRALAAEEQELTLSALRTDAALYIHALLDAVEAQRDAAPIRDEALVRARAAFRRMKELAAREHERGGGGLSLEVGALEQLEREYCRWLEDTAALARAVVPSEETRLLRVARHTLDQNVEPLLRAAVRLEQDEKARLVAGSVVTFRAAQLMGVGFPGVSLLLVGGLALSMLMPLRRLLKDFLAGAERVGKGDFGLLLPEERRDEAGAMARAFNRMARELRDTVAEKQRLARAEAEAAERETRHYNTLLESMVRQRTVELERANERLSESVRQLQATQSQLLFSDRLASVGQLAAGVGHEINNPLAFIISNLEYVREELLKQGGAEGSPRAEWVTALSEAREGAERVRVIVSELGNMARPDIMESGPVDLGAVARSAGKMAMHLIRARAVLTLEVDGAPPVYGNGARLCQVLLNLLLNAAHAIQPGQVERNTIRVSARSEGAEMVLVEVSDTGCGIPPENLGRIFNPFFTTRPVGEGTGLGLAVCHGIVASHGGEMSVESEVGRGSTFRVRLPVFAEGVRTARSAGAAREPSPGADEQPLRVGPEAAPGALRRQSL